MEQSPTEPRPPVSIGHFAFAFGIVVLLWLLLAGNLRPDELLAALVAGVLVIAVSASRLSIVAGVRLRPGAAIFLAAYLGVFVAALVRANIDMARRVLSPSLPIRPSVVEIRTGLESSLGKLLLANSITLTPGTLSVDVQGDRILVHWIDCPPGADIESATRMIAESFERHISGFLR
jgi:multicomponent Na+:H+ antiporter subunit E